jgi:hypothetical protein
MRRSMSTNTSCVFALQLSRTTFFVPETVLEKSHAIAMSLYVCNYNDEESVAGLQHVMDRINHCYNELRGDIDDE